MNVTCANCKLKFEAVDQASVKQCPRCSSRTSLRFEKTDVEKKADAEAAKVIAAEAAEKPKVPATTGIVYGDTKNAWQSFHHNESKLCPKCSGTEFELNYKRKERVCKKCGEILSMPRRFS